MAFIHFALFICFSSVRAFDSEIVSDLMAPAGDERRSLEIKSEQFWELIKEVAKDTNLYEHMEVYGEVEAALYFMPEENVQATALLSEALLRLRRADGTVLEQTVRSSDLAAEKLAAGPAAPGMFNFMTGGHHKNFLSSAIKRFIGGDVYAGKVANHVANRQADILPTLQDAATMTGSVLGDCRTASKLAFDMLKYDIYNEGVPKTPEVAKAAAYRLIDAAGQTRHHFTQGIVGMANALAKDTQEKDVDPSLKVTQTLHADLERFGAGVEARAARGATTQNSFV